MTEDPDDSAQPPFTDSSGEDVPLSELEAPLHRPPSWRKRLRRIGLGLAATLIMLVLFWRTSALDQPPPQPLAPHPNALLLLSNVTYGAVTINGQQHPWSLPMLLPIQNNTSAIDITLNAPPFRAVSCQVDLDVASLSIDIPATDRNCAALPVSTIVPLAQSSVVHSPIFRVFLFLTLADLPANQQSQVTALLAQALTVQQEITVPVDSYFATSFLPPTITSQRTSVPLWATASLALAKSSPQGTGFSCVDFICAQPITPLTVVPASGPQWSVQVGVALRWVFSSTSDTVVSDVPFWGTTPSAPVANTIPLFLTRNTAGDWTISYNAPVPHIAYQLQGTFCSVGASILRLILLADAEMSLVEENDRGVQGCELRVFLNGTFQGLYLWRFGVLLAANAQAQDTHPELPVAPPAEISAVEPS